MISVAAELVGHAPADAAHLRGEGPRDARRTPGGTRLYSELRRRAPAADPAADDRARSQPRRRRAVLGLEDELRRLRSAPRAARGASCEPRFDADPPRSTGATSCSTDRSHLRDTRRGEAQPRRSVRRAMDFNKLTIKIQEAVAARSGARASGGQPRAHAAITCCSRCSSRSCRARCCSAPAPSPARSWPRPRRASARCRRSPARTPSRRRARRSARRSTTPSTRRGSSTTTSSRPSTSCSRSSSSRATRCSAR